MFNLRLLGTPQINLPDQPGAALPAAKSQAILFYLACRGRVQSRLFLAGLLWPDKPDNEARMNLRQALYQLRQMAPQLIDAQRDQIALNPNVALQVDSVLFEQEVKAGLNGAWAQLAAAADRYQGDFLTGFYLDDSPPFEEWLLLERERLHGLAVQTFHQLAIHYSQQGENGAGILACGRLLSLEPLREESHQQLMRLLAADGQISAALAQYDRCRQLLADELGVEPSPTTKSLYESIKAGKLTQTRPHPYPHSSLPHNLPPHPTPFIGRERELNALDTAFHQQSARLVTIVGPGGIGKTRLSLAFARQCRRRHPDRYPDGIYFVSFANIQPITGLSLSNQVCLTIAQTLQLSPDNTTSPRQLLFNFLASRRMLLVLDNFEHLLDTHELIAAMGAAAPGLCLLISSRERLNLYEEHLIPLQGLRLPDEEQLMTPLAEQPEAVQLFLQAARRVQPQFNPEAAELPALLALCRLLNGIPLAIELAAAWVTTLSLTEILAELDHDLGLLHTRLNNVADRHRSLSQVFDYAWQRLSPEEQQLLAALTVFQGSFTRAAAAAIIGHSISPHLLANLVHHSLITIDAVGQRYSIHELLRRFTAAKARESSTLAVHVPQRFSHYFCTLLQQSEAELRGAGQEKRLPELEADLGNIRLAWQWAVARRDIEGLAAALNPLFHLYDTRSRFLEGEQLFREAAQRLSWDAPDPVEVHTLARLQARQGWFTFHLGQQKESLRLLNLSLLAVRRQGDHQEIAFCLNYLGAIMRHQGKYQEALAYLQEALHLAQTSGDKYGASISLNTLGQTAFMQEDYPLARHYCQEGLRLKQEIGERRGMIYSLTYLGRIAEVLGEYGEAQKLFQESLHISTAIGDRRGMGIAWENLGDVALALRHDAAAKTAFHKGLTLFRNIGDRLGSGRCLLRLGELGTVQGALVAAAAHFREGLEIALAIQAEPVLLEGIVGVAGLWVQANQPEQAQVILEFIDHSPQKEMVRPRRLAPLRHALTNLPPTLNTPLPATILEQFVREWVLSFL